MILALRELTVKRETQRLKNNEAYDLLTNSSFICYSLSLVLIL